MTDVTALASYRNAVEHIRRTWPGFLERRDKWLQQQARNGTAAEKVAENIVQDLFTGVLNWSVGDLNNQIRYADILLTQLGIGNLVLETKRPGSLAWNRRAVNVALDQARRYAAEQRVGIVAVSDGTMFYAADIVNGGLQDRVFCNLDDIEPAVDELWWISLHGIYRPRQRIGSEPRHLPEGEAVEPAQVVDALLHPKYHLPARCFAYVGNASDTSTWKLPFLCADGSVDTKRLPKAIQTIVTNYRGAKVQGIPEKAIHAVLERLAEAAKSIGRMSPAAESPAPVYLKLAEAIAQMASRESFKTTQGQGASRPGEGSQGRTKMNLDSFS